jgi:alpha-tubulin suppressor-like RCC1 family protein
MHDGLRGYVLSKPSHIVIFGTELDVEDGVKTIEQFRAYDDARIGGVEMDSRGGVYVGVDGGVWYLENVWGLRDLEATSAPGERIGEVRTKQICTNATTATALGEDGKVYTATRDPRYAKCLGRAYTGSTEFEALPYFSETCVKKISSGGYMSAAVSEDGELFLWGQANPGGGEQLAVLKEEGREVETGIIVEEGQDEMVKCLSVFIEHEEASVYDVAVGHGHILVAAEVQRGGGTTRRAVFGAGESGKGQLGLPSKAGFVRNFEELPAFSDAKVQQLVATAWSTFVVTVED